MTFRLIALALCLAANALLATILFQHHSNRSRAVNSDATKTSNPGSAETNPATVKESLMETSPANFQWAQLTAADFAPYIVNLRAFVAPEQKIRDIIFGAVEAIYRPRRAQLQPQKKADDGKFWEHRNFWMAQGIKEQRGQMRALRKEESDLLKSLLGADVYEQLEKDSGNDHFYNWLPKELREKAQDIDAQMNDAKQEIYAANSGYMDQYAQSDLRKVEKKYRDQLAAILTPDQLLEWDLRNSDEANQLKNNLSAFDPNEDEFRALFKYQQAKDDLNPPPDPDADPQKLTADERAAVAEKQKELDAELAQAVGTNRIAEYKLEQDYSYRNLIDSGVPKESVLKLDQMKNDAQAATKKIRNDKTLSADDRATALSAIRTETQNSINELLGPKPAKSYSGNGGWWLNNIVPATK
jgi:hypothetical protein